MVIKDNGFFDWAIPDPGPEEKVYQERNKLLAYIPHDMVGYYHGPGSYTRMRTDAQASWGGSIGYNAMGKPVMWQHYPVWASTWTSSSRYWNTRGFTTETVRTENPINDYNPEPMPDDLVEIHMLVLEDLEEYLNRVHGYDGRFFRKPELGLSVLPNRRLILEHREVHPQDNATTCPNGRMSRLYAALANREEPEMEEKLTDEEFLEFMERLEDRGKLDEMGFIDRRFREIDGKRYAIMRQALHEESQVVEDMYDVLVDAELI